MYMRIGIDARLYGTYGRGIGQYLKQLITELEQLDTHNEYVIFVNNHGWKEYTPNNSQFQKVLANIQLYTFKEQWLLPLLISRAKIDCMHFPHFTVPLCAHTPYIVTIHDMIIHKFPTEYATKHWYPIYRLKLLAYKAVLKQAVRRATHIITVSQRTHDDVIEYYPTAQKKCAVIHEGVDPALMFCTEDQTAVLKKYNLTSKQYLFYIGAAYPHKNLHAMITGYMSACEYNNTLKQYPFIIAGRRDFFHEKTEHWLHTTFPHQTHRVQWIGEISDKERSILYAHAALFLYITEYEGFGLPVLEAMSFGTPVVVSNAGSLPEVAADAALYVEPHDTEKIAHTIVHLLTHPDILSEYSHKGIDRVKAFSWTACAQKTLECYQQILNSKE